MRALIELARGSGETASTRFSNHADRVGGHAAALGAAMGLPRETCDRLRLCGLLHDVGKAMLPEAILAKPGPLTADEYELVKRHPWLGVQMMRPEPGLADVREWTLAHHERPDGHGYPLRRAAGQIPLEARIIAVADAYTAMVADRPYRPALSHWRACNELAQGAGTQYDGEVVRAFLAGFRAPAIAV